MNITYVNINDLKLQAPINEQWKSLPLEVQKDIQSYRQEQDQWRVLGGKLLLNQAIENSKFEQSLSNLSYTNRGKPFFKHSNFQFNISHSGDYVVLVTSNGQLCGIDIEMHREINWVNFKRNFTSKEWEVILNAENSTTQFFHFWAIKESIIKADGRGVAVLGKTEILSEEEAICDEKLWNIKPFQLIEEYSSCIAIDAPITDILIESYL